MNNNKTLKYLIIAISVVVPLLVAVLYLLPDDIKDMGIDTSFLPTLNAILNSSTAVLLILAVVFVKQGKYELHKKTMLSAMGLGAVFLLSYVAYHATTYSAIYGDINGDKVLDDSELSLIGSSQTIYRAILLSHILLSMIVLPFVLFSAYLGLIENNEKHKKVVKLAYPVWLYVSISGVVVYFMISPYYG